ncbi:MAG: ROK family protein, partial [Treponema sp.]|nr:ROK family protein [Treponema sp.]
MRHRLGIDIGSTTIKLAVMDSERKILFSEYKRHLSNIQETLLEMVNRAYDRLGDISFTALITGSGGLSLANWAGITFIQEVEAVANAIALYAPQT